jgi:hypothetical protein
MLNYEVAPRLLDKYVPCGTVLDSFLGKAYEFAVTCVDACNESVMGHIRFPHKA